MKVVDMKRTDREKKADQEKYMIGPSITGDDYAYGLRLRLGDDELKKIGIDEMPKAGDVFKIEGEGRVTSTETRDGDAGQGRHVEMVLHRLGAEPKESDNIRADIEKARHQAGGTSRPSIGARFARGG